MKAVEKGAAFLDEVEPGWYEKIDPATLDLGSGCNEGQSAGRLGFIEYGRARFSNMTAAWRREIQKRRKS